MEIITIIMITVALAIYLARFVIRAPGQDMLAGVIGVGAIALTIMDNGIENEMIRLVLCLPVVFTTLISFNSLAFGKSGKESKRRRW